MIVYKWKRNNTLNYLSLSLYHSFQTPPTSDDDNTMATTTVAQPPNKTESSTSPELEWEYAEAPNEKKNGNNSEIMYNFIAPDLLESQSKLTPGSIGTDKSSERTNEQTRSRDIAIEL